MNSGIDQKKKKKIHIGDVKHADCQPDEEYDAGLCYKPCRDGYRGIGPVCWMKGGVPCMTNCGAFYAKETSDCVSNIVGMVTSPLITIGEVALAALSGGASEVAEQAGEQATESLKDYGKAMAKDAFSTLSESQKEVMDAEPETQEALDQLDAAYKKLQNDNPEDPKLVEIKAQYDQLKDLQVEASTIANQGKSCIDEISNSFQGKEDRRDAVQQMSKGLECAPDLPFGVSDTIEAYAMPICLKLNKCIINHLCFTKGYGFQNNPPSHTGFCDAGATFNSDGTLDFCGCKTSEIGQGDKDC
jgi:hypothetical protein